MDADVRRPAGRLQRPIPATSTPRAAEFIGGRCRRRAAMGAERCPRTSVDQIFRAGRACGVGEYFQFSVDDTTLSSNHGAVARLKQTGTAHFPEKEFYRLHASDAHRKVQFASEAARRRGCRPIRWVDRLSCPWATSCA
ncbi:MAG: hypothetical protein ACLSVD_10940 [Eggerthellaceae bacterium]